MLGVRANGLERLKTRLPRDDLVFTGFSPSNAHITCIDKGGVCIRCISSKGIMRLAHSKDGAVIGNAFS